MSWENASLLQATIKALSKSQSSGLRYIPAAVSSTSCSGNIITRRVAGVKGRGCVWGGVGSETHGKGFWALTPCHYGPVWTQRPAVSCSLLSAALSVLRPNRPAASALDSYFLFLNIYFEIQPLQRGADIICFSAPLFLAPGLASTSYCALARRKYNLENMACYDCERPHEALWSLRMLIILCKYLRHFRVECRAGAFCFRALLILHIGIGNAALRFE